MKAILYINFTPIWHLVIKIREVRRVPKHSNYIFSCCVRIQNTVGLLCFGLETLYYILNPKHSTVFRLDDGSIVTMQQCNTNINSGFPFQNRPSHFTCMGAPLLSAYRTVVPIREPRRVGLVATFHTSSARQDKYILRDN